MSVINTFTPSTIISSSQVNANFVDIATELTNSLAADGQTTMLGAIKGDNGTAAAPSYSFASDLNTGFYRKAADSIGMATGGAERVYIDSAGKLFALGAADIAGALNLQSTLAVAGAVTLSGALTVGSLEVGNADTTLARASAGNLTVEGNALYRAGGTDVAVTDGGTGASTAANAFTALKQDASDTATGVLEIAVQSEMETATDVLRAVTPGRQHFHPSATKAWVRWNGSTSTILAGYNVSSITDNGTGDFTINFTTAFSSANYAVAGMSNSNGGGSGTVVSVESSANALAGSCRLNIKNDDGLTIDGSFASAMFCGDQ